MSRRLSPNMHNTLQNMSSSNSFLHRSAKKDIQICCLPIHVEEVKCMKVDGSWHVCGGVCQSQNEVSEAAEIAVAATPIE